MTCDTFHTPQYNPNINPDELHPTQLTQQMCDSGGNSTSSFGYVIVEQNFKVDVTLLKFVGRVVLGVRIRVKNMIDARVDGVTILKMGAGLCLGVGPILGYMLQIGLV